jgi:hypothetical protein
MRMRAGGKTVEWPLRLMREKAGCVAGNVVASSELAVVVAGAVVAADGAGARSQPIASIAAATIAENPHAFPVILTTLIGKYIIDR